MKKTVFKAIIFTLIFCILISFVSYAINLVDKQGYKIIREFYEQRENSLDAVYIGSSNCFTFWNPVFAWNDYGITVYPYSCNANPIYSTKYLIEETRKTQSDATFIVNLNSLTDGELDQLHMHNIISSLPFSRTKLELIDHLCDIGDYEGLDRAEFYFPFIRFHSRWPYFNNGTQLSSRLNGHKGAVSYAYYTNTSTDVSDLYVAPTGTIELSEKLIYSTDLLLDYCDEENIEVLFIVVPQARGSEYDMNRMETLDNYISERGYTVLNFSENFEEEMNIDMTKDYFNGPHTNIHGSIKYTRYLSEYLIDNYGFEDKRQDEAYADWHTAYASYMETACAYTLDIEFDYEHRMFSLEEPEFEVKAYNNSSYITYTTVDKADGYLIYSKSGLDSPWECIADVSAENDSNEYIHQGISDEITYYYTVVPYTIQNGERFYGDFNYTGLTAASTEITAAETP